MHALKPGFMKRHGPGTKLSSPAAHTLGQHPNVSADEREKISIRIVDGIMSIMSGLEELKTLRDEVMADNLGGITILGPFLAKGEMLTAFVQAAGQLGGAANQLQAAAGVYLTPEDDALLGGVHDAIRAYSGSISALDQAPISATNEMWVGEFIDLYTREPFEITADVSRMIVTAEASGVDELPDEPGIADTTVLVGFAAVTAIGVGIWWLTDYLGL